MLETLKSMFIGSADKLVDSVGEAIDRLVTSDEERILLKNALVEARLRADLEGEKNALVFEKEVTARWLSDNEHAITRLVRPAIVAWSYFLFSIAILGDGNVGDFTINPSYIPVIETIIITVTVAYFGSRGYEKAKRYSVNKLVGAK